MSVVLGSPYLIIGVVLALMTGYILPIMIALIRQIDEIWIVVLFSLVLVAWPVALFCAVTYPSKRHRLTTSSWPIDAPVPYYGAGRTQPPTGT